MDIFLMEFGTHTLLFKVLSGFVFACVWQFSPKHGIRFKNNVIPQNSVLRKFYPFKESEFNPLIYVKLVPFYICFLILIAVLILYIVYWINPESLEAFLISPGVNIAGFVYLILTFIYLAIMVI